MIFPRSIVVPRTREALSLEAMAFRKKYNLGDAYVDVERLVGLEMQKNSIFYVAVREDEDLAKAYVDPANQQIHMPQSLHDQMFRKIPSARETVMKMVAHCHLHQPQNVISRGKIAGADITCSDWQATTFAEQILGHKFYMPAANNSEVFARLTGITAETSARLWEQYKRSEPNKNKEREVLETSLSFDHRGRGR